MEEFLLLSHLGPFAAGGRGVHIFPPGPGLHRGLQKVLVSEVHGERN